MPHLEYTADIDALESKLEGLGLCDVDDPKCIMDFPSVAGLTAAMNSIVDGGLEIAIELAKTAQPKSDILTGFSGGIIPTMTAEDGAIITIDETATLVSEGTADFTTLDVDNLNIETLNVDTINSAVDFGSHLLTNVNLDLATLKIEGTAMIATAEELNVLTGVDVEVTSTELNMLKTLDINEGDLNVLKGVSADVDGVALSNLATLDINPGDLNVLKGVDHALDSTALNNLVGLTVDAATLNILAGADPELTSAHLNNVKGLNSNAAELNVLSGVNPLLTSTELNMLVGLDINAGDLNVLKGIDANLNSADLNKIVGLTADAGDLNVLDGIDNSITIEELNKLVGLKTEAAQLNILDNVNTALGHQELNLLVGLDINSVADLNVLEGIDPGLTAAHINNIKGLTATSAELNILDGIDTTITSAEINLLKGLESPAAQLNILKDVNTNLGHTELNQLLNLDINVGDLNVLKGVDHALDKDDLNKIIGITTSAAELNTLTGIDTTISNDEWNRLVGLETDAAQLNILKDVSTSLDKDELNRLVGLDINPGDLNVLKGVDASLSKTELDKLVGLTVTAAELNELDHGNGTPLTTKVEAAEFALINDITTMGQTQNSKAVTTDASGNVQFNGDVEIDGDLDIPNGQLKLQGVNLDVTVTASIINDATTHFNELTATVDEINSALDGIEATAAELNKLHGVTATTAEFNRLDIATVGETAANKAVSADSSGNVKFNNNAVFDALLNAKSTFKINDVTVTASATELNLLNGVSTGLTKDELDYLDLAAATPGATENSKVVTSDASGNVQFNGHVTVNNQDLKLTKDKLKIDNVAVTTTAAELNVLDGIAAGLTVAELNILDGVTASTSDLNVLATLASAGVTTDDINMLRGVGASSANNVANRALVTDNAGNVNMQVVTVDEIDIPKDKLKIANVAVTTTAAELNVLDGVDTTITVGEIDTLKDLTSTADELNKLDGATVSTADINMLTGVSASDANNVANRVVVTDGTAGGHVKLVDVTISDELKVAANKLHIADVAVTATAADLNKLDGMTSSKAELNILTGVTATTAEINTLDGITATAADINMLEGLNADRTNAAADKVVVLDANGDVSLPNVANINIANVDTLKINDGSSYITVTTSAAELNALVGLTSSNAELGRLSTLDATAAELNIMHGVTATTDDINMLQGVDASRANDVAGRVVVLDDNGDLTLPRDVQMNEIDVTGTLKIAGVAVTVTASELNAFSGLDVAAEKLNILDGVTATTADINKLVTDATTADFNLLAGLGVGSEDVISAATADTQCDVDLASQMKYYPDTTSAVFFDAANCAKWAQMTLANNGKYCSTKPLLVDGTDPNNCPGGFAQQTITGFTGYFSFKAGNSICALCQGATPKAGAGIEFRQVSTVITGDSTNSVADRAVVLDASGNLNVANNMIADHAEFKRFFVDGTELTVIPELNSLSGLVSTSAELNAVAGMTASMAELNILSGATITTEDINILSGVQASDRSNSDAGKAVVLKDDGTLELNNDMEIKGVLNVDTLHLNGNLLDVSVLELNTLNGILADVTELNTMHGVTATTAEINILSGLESDTADLNLLKGRDDDRTNSVADRAVVLDSSGLLTLPNEASINIADIDTLKIDGVEVTSTAAELNVLTGVDTGLTSAELNILLGATITTDELNHLAGIVSSVQDLNLLEGRDADRTNSVADRAVVLDSAGNLVLPQITTVSGTLDVNTFKIDGVEVTSTAAELNALDGVLANVAEMNTLVGVDSNFEETDLDILIGFTGDASDLNTLYDVGICKDQNGVINTAQKLKRDCIDGSFCGDIAEVVGNGTAHEDQASCEAESDCGPIASNQQCAFTHNNFYTDTSTCSDGTDKIETACVAIGTCSAAAPTCVKNEAAVWSDEDASPGNHGNCDIATLDCSKKGDTTELCIQPYEDGGSTACCKLAPVVGNGATHDDDTVACTAASVCGPNESTEQCVFTPANTWTASGTCSDASHNDKEADCLAPGSCSDSSEAVGLGATHHNEADCEAASDCGLSYAGQCAHTRTHTWEGASCYNYATSTDVTSSYGTSGACLDVGTCTEKTARDYCVKNEDAIWHDEVVNGPYDAGACEATLDCTAQSGTTASCINPYEDGGVLKATSPCCKIENKKVVGNGATHDGDKSACDAASVCGIGNDQLCEHTSSYAWNPVHCSRDVDPSVTQCATAEYPQGINCGSEDGYYWDGAAWAFQIISSGITQGTCENYGTCADGNGVAGLGAANDNDPATCNAATNCGPQIHDQQCVWHHTNTYTDTSVCSDGGLGTEAACIAPGGCAAAGGVAGNGGANDGDKAACEASSICGTAVPQSQCAFTQSHTWDLSGTCKIDGCNDSSDKNEAECKAVGTCADDSGNVGNGATYADNKDACEAASDCGPAIQGGSACVWAPTNTWYSVGTCSDAAYHDNKDGCELAGFVFTETPSCSDTNHADEATCLETQGTCADATGVVGNGASYTTKTTCNQETTACGVRYEEDCAWTQTNLWHEVVGAHVDDPTACLTAGGCAAADGGVGNGASYDDDKATCIAATDCGEVASTDQCIWHIHTWGYGASKADKAVIADANGDVTFGATLSAASLDIPTHTAASPKLKINGIDIIVGAADLNKLKDVTATTDELNYLSVTTLGDTEALRAVTADANGDVTFNGDVSVSGNMVVTDVIVDGVTMSADAKTGLNQLENLNAINAAKISAFNDIDVGKLSNVAGTTATTEDLNKLTGLTISTAQKDALNNLGKVNLDVVANIQNFMAIDANTDATVNDLTVTGALTVGAGVLHNCVNFIHTGTACRNDSTDHILFNTSDNEVYLCTATNVQIKIS